MPDVNESIAGWEVDVLWRNKRIAIELDGHGNHHTPAQRRRDRRKDLALRKAGYTPVRYSEEQLEQQSEPSKTSPASGALVSRVVSSAAPRGATGGWIARTQGRRRSSATPRPEDAASRRRATRMPSNLRLRALARKHIDRQPQRLLDVDRRDAVDGDREQRHAPRARAHFVTWSDPAEQQRVDPLGVGHDEPPGGERIPLRSERLPLGRRPDSQPAGVDRRPRRAPTRARRSRSARSAARRRRCRSSGTRRASAARRRRPRWGSGWRRGRARCGGRTHGRRAGAVAFASRRRSPRGTGSTANAAAA